SGLRAKHLGRACMPCRLSLTSFPAFSHSSVCPLLDQSPIAGKNLRADDSIVQHEVPGMGEDGENNNGKLKAKRYEKEMRKLQAELCILQEWVKAKGKRIVIVFEGRDGAGKGGTIRAITERVS